MGLIKFMPGRSLYRAKLSGLGPNGQIYCLQLTSRSPPQEPDPTTRRSQRVTVHPGREIKYRPPRSPASLVARSSGEAPASASSRSACPETGPTCSRLPAVARVRRSGGVRVPRDAPALRRQWRRAGRPMHVRVVTATNRADDVRERTWHLHPPTLRALGEHAHVRVLPMARRRADSDGVPAVGRTPAAGVRSCPLKLSSPPQATTSYR